MHACVCLPAWMHACTFVCVSFSFNFLNKQAPTNLPPGTNGPPENDQSMTKSRENDDDSTPMKKNRMYEQTLEDQYATLNDVQDQMNDLTALRKDASSVQTTLSVAYDNFNLTEADEPLEILDMHAKSVMSIDGVLLCSDAVDGDDKYSDAALRNNANLDDIYDDTAEMSQGGKASGHATAKYTQSNLPVLEAANVKDADELVRDTIHDGLTDLDVYDNTYGARVGERQPRSETVKPKECDPHTAKDGLSAAAEGNASSFENSSVSSQLRRRAYSILSTITGSHDSEKA